MYRTEMTICECAKMAAGLYVFRGVEMKRGGGVKCKADEYQTVNLHLYIHPCQFAPTIKFA